MFSSTLFEFQTMQPVIKARDLTKIYRIGQQQDESDSVFGAVANVLKSPVRNFRKYRSLYNFDDALAVGREDASPDVLWALEDVSFDVHEGDSLAIVGANGAGKSTLLKVLSRVANPTKGTVHMRGSVSSLLEVGTGFHRELTGRENIYLNGSVLGMKRHEINAQFDEIVDFSGVEQFLDTPIKRYSSGMSVRLAFAVAAHLQSDIMILDEVLSVGDVAFQRKCLNKMNDVAGSGRTVLFVSHNMPMITALCKSGIFLQKGKVVAEGTADDIVKLYMQSLQGNEQGLSLTDRKDRRGDQK